MTIEDIFSYILLIALFGGAWGIYIKIKEFSKFLKENGWQPVRKKIRNFFSVILCLTIYTLIGNGIKRRETKNIIVILMLQLLHKDK